LFQKAVAFALEFKIFNIHFVSSHAAAYSDFLTAWFASKRARIASRRCHSASKSV
jgi:hypothetical protein